MEPAQEEFQIPNSPEDLEIPQEGCPAVKDVLKGTDWGPEELQQLLKLVVYDLCENDALAVVEEGLLSSLYTACKYFAEVESAGRSRLVDSLCSNLTVLSSSTQRLLELRDDIHLNSIVLHRSALKIFVYFLHWIWSQADKEHRDFIAKGGAETAANSRGRKKQSRASALEWNWDEARRQIISSVATIVRVDINPLFRPCAPPEALLLRFSHMGQWLFREPALARDSKCRTDAFRVLCSAALTYNQIDGMSASLVNLLTEYEHLPPIFAQLAQFGVTELKDSRMAVALLQEIAVVDPVSYKEQQSADSKGLRNAAQFLEKLAEAVPQVVVGHVALLAPHLGGEAYSLRSAIITMFGHCIHKAFDKDGSVDDRNAAARIKSKQSLLDTLLVRCRDQNAYTRSRALQTWSFLAREACIPISHWMIVSKVAVGRFQDKAAVVRKSAMQLVQSLLHFNPFGRYLNVERFQGTLRDLEAQLEQTKADEAARTAELASGDVTEALEGDKESQEEFHDAAEAGSEVPESGGNAEETAADSDGKQAEQNAGDSAADKAPVQVEKESQEYEVTSEDLEGGEGSLPYIIASIKVAISFIRTLMSSIGLIQQLLASDAVTDVNEAINLVTDISSFKVEGHVMALRSMLPLVFSREESVRKAVVDSVAALFLSNDEQSAEEKATSILALIHGSSVGDLAAIDDIVGHLVTDSGMLDSSIIHSLWQIARAAKAQEQTAAAGTARGWSRSAMQLLSMVARHRPSTVVDNLDLLTSLASGTSASAADLTIVRHSAICVMHAGLHMQSRNLSEDRISSLLKALSGIVVASPLPNTHWFSAAEAVVGAVYAVHPEPDNLVAALIDGLAQLASPELVSTSAADAPAAQATGKSAQPQAPCQSAESGCVAGGAGQSGADEEASSIDSPNVPKDVRLPQASDTRLVCTAISLSKLFFMIGQVAMEQLIYIEKLTGNIRRRMAEEAKRVTEAQQSQTQPKDAEDIGAELGVGTNTATADAELDAIKEASEKQIASGSQLLGSFMPMLQAACHSKRILDCHPLLRSSAILALAKLMVVDDQVCENNLPLIFSLLKNRSLEPSIRSNLVIACGDLFVRFPNLLEPWTGHLYQVLSDPDTGVRKNSVMVITHLILNDMMKVKGHVASMAVCLEDEDQRISDLAKLFFHELAGKSFKNSNPVFSLLPDMLSSLSANPEVSTPKFRAIMKHLLALVCKDKHMDALVEKMCHRLGKTDEPARWRDIAFCMSQLNFTDKGLRTLVDSFKLYKYKAPKMNALQEEEVTNTIKDILNKKGSGTEKEAVRTLVEDFNEMFSIFAEERQEEAEAARKAKEYTEGADAQEDSNQEETAAEVNGAVGDADNGSQCGSEAHTDDDALPDSDNEEEEQKEDASSQFGSAQSEEEDGASESDDDGEENTESHAQDAPQPGSVFVKKEVLLQVKEEPVSPGPATRRQRSSNLMARVKSEPMDSPQSQRSSRRCAVLEDSTNVPH